MAAELFSVALLLVALQVSTTSACNGYEFLISKIEPCPNVKSVIQLTNFNVSLSDDCIVSPTGTITYPNIKSAKVTLNAMFNVIPIQRAADFCSLIRRVPSVVAEKLKKYDIETSCPFSARTIDVQDFAMDISPYKDLLSLGLGRTYGQVRAVLDSGVACYNFDTALRLKPGNKAVQPNWQDMNQLRSSFSSFGLSKEV